MTSAVQVPTCKPCNTLMVKGPEGFRCLNCGYPTGPADVLTPEALNSAFAMLRDLSEQSAAALQDQHHAAATAVGMSAKEPWGPVVHGGKGR